MDTPSFAAYLNANERVRTVHGTFSTKRARRFAEDQGALVWRGRKARKRAYVDMRLLEVLAGSLVRARSEVYRDAAE